LYAYVHDSPTNFTDPTGQFAFLAVAAVGCAIGAATSAIANALAGKKTTVGDLLTGCFVGAVLSVLGEWLGPMILGSAFVRSLPIIRSIVGGERVASALSYDAKLLAKTDLYHSFPTLMDDWIVKGGTIGKQTASYIEYHMPGYINKASGTYQVGIDTIRNVVTHRFFEPPL